MKSQVTEDASEGFNGRQEGGGVARNEKLAVMRGNISFASGKHFSLLRNGHRVLNCSFEVQGDSNGMWATRKAFRNILCIKTVNEAVLLDAVDATYLCEYCRPSKE